MLKQFLFFTALVFSSASHASKKEDVNAKKVASSKNGAKFLNLDDFGMGIEHPLDIQEETVKYARTRKDSNMTKAFIGDHQDDRLNTNERSPGQLFRKKSLMLTSNAFSHNRNSDELVDRHMFHSLY